MSGNNIINHVTRTIYGAYLQTCRVLLRPLDIKEFTTVNEAINDSIKVPFQPRNKTLGAQVTEDFDPVNDSANIKIGYVVIGNGGHVTSITSNDTDYMNFNVHQATDASLFKMLPFICRPIDNDIPDEERVNYRLRKVLEIAGETYVAYYAKKLDFSNSEVTMTLSRTENSVTEYNPFIPTVNNLRPQPVQPGYENDGTKTFTAAKTTFTFDEKDANYFTEACINMFGSANEAIISEIGFCSGVDKPIVRSYGTGTGQTADSSIKARNLLEAQAVQICCFVNTYYQANFGINGLEFAFDVGAIEPLFGRTNKL